MNTRHAPLWILTITLAFGACRSVSTDRSQIPIPLPVSSPALKFGMSLQDFPNDPNGVIKKPHRRITVVPVKFEKDGDLIFPAVGVFLDKRLVRVSIIPTYLAATAVPMNRFEESQAGFRQACFDLYGVEKQRSTIRRPDTGESVEQMSWEMSDFTAVLKMPHAKENMSRLEVVGGLNLSLSQDRFAMMGWTDRANEIQGLLDGI